MVTFHSNLQFQSSGFWPACIAFVANPRSCCRKPIRSFSVNLARKRQAKKKKKRKHINKKLGLTHSAKNIEENLNKQQHFLHTAMPSQRFHTTTSVIEKIAREMIESVFTHEKVHTNHQRCAEEKWWEIFTAIFLLFKDHKFSFVCSPLYPTTYDERERVKRKICRRKSKILFTDFALTIRWII